MAVSFFTDFAAWGGEMQKKRYHFAGFALQ